MPLWIETKSVSPMGKRKKRESIYALAVTKHHFENITQDSHVLTVLAQLNYLLYASPDSYYTGF